MLKFSKKFRELLQRVSYNKVSKNLLLIERLSGEPDHRHPGLAAVGMAFDSFDYNFISIGDTNRLVTFTPSDKVEKILSDLPKVYGVSSIRNLTHSNSNNTIFGLIGYDKSVNDYWYPEPSCDCIDSVLMDGGLSCGCGIGDKGKIINEVVSPSTDKVYVLFKCLDTGRLSVVNKKAIIISDNSDVIFTVNRNSIKVGRLVRLILTTAGIKFITKDIEDFVNLYKSSYDFSTNKDIQFNIVTGDKIAFWYNGDNYVGGGGQLSNSCMANKPKEFFNIYSKNSCCSMVILYSDDGILKQGSYESDRIKGRALLWDVKYNGRMVKFLDRIYCNVDSDIELFKTYAKNKGWYRKVEQTMYPEACVTLDGNEIDDRFEVELDTVDMDYFPYMDTMCFCINEDGCLIITNDKELGHTREFRCTNGTYLKIRDNREVGYGGIDADFLYPEYNEDFDPDPEYNEDFDPDEVEDEVEMPIDQMDEGECVEQSIGRIRRESNVSEVQSILHIDRLTAGDLDRVRELIIESSRVPRRYFDNIPREVDPTPPPSEPVFNLDDDQSDVNFGYGDGDDLPF